MNSKLLIAALLLISFVNSDTIQVPQGATGATGATGANLNVQPPQPQVHVDHVIVVHDNPNSAPQGYNNNGQNPNLGLYWNNFDTAQNALANPLTAMQVPSGYTTMIHRNPAILENFARNRFGY